MAGLPGYALSRLGLLQMRLNIALASGFLLIASSFAVPSSKVGGFDVPMFAVVALSLVGWKLMSGIQRQLDAFAPETPLEAKRLNEQIKLMANMVNTVAGGTVTAIAFAQITKAPNNPNMTIILMACGFGLWVHMGARGLLLHLKDESASPVSSK